MRKTIFQSVSCLSLFPCDDVILTESEIPKSRFTVE